MTLSSSFTIFITIISIAVPAIEAGNIVGIYTLDMKSHYFIAQNVLKELAKSGHNVTVFTGFKSNNLPPNYREVHVNLPNLDGKLYTYLKSRSKYADFRFYRIQKEHG